MKISRTRLNLRIVIPVALMSIASVALSFVPLIKAERQTVLSAELQPSEIQTNNASGFDEIAYYEQVAEEFMSMLPTDKRVIARLIDSVNHHIIYYETTESPSCYCYDLETQNTSVLFGSESGFYIDTKLLILDKIIDCRRVGDWAVFIATNRAPETTIDNAVHTFGLNLFDHSMRYIAVAAEAYFPNDTQLQVTRITWHYRSLFTNEDYYGTESTTYDL